MTSFQPTKEQIEELKSILLKMYGMSIIVTKTGVNKGLDKDNPLLDHLLKPILENGKNFDDMCHLARKIPITIEDEQRVYLSDYYTNKMNVEPKDDLRKIIKKFYKRELNKTLFNDNLMPDEVEKQLSTDLIVQGEKELKSELYNRFKRVNIAEDWERYVFEITRAIEIHVSILTALREGGGDPDKIFVYYNVFLDACDYCKEKLLDENGNSKIFILSDIIRNIEMTGGTNFGCMQAEINPNIFLIDDDEYSWYPYSCYSRVHRVIKGYPIIKSR